MSEHEFVTERRPALRNRDKEMIPKTLVRAMFGLALASLAIVAFAVVTDRAHVGQPKASTPVESLSFTLESQGAQSVRLVAPDGAVLLDLDQGGFVAVIQNAVARERLVKRVPENAPVDLVRYENGRLAIHDPETGWSAELGSFGKDNKAAFERLFSL